MQRVLNEIQVVVERHGDAFADRALPFNIIIALSVIGHLLSLASSSIFSSLFLMPSSLFTMELWRLLTSPFVGHNILVLSWTAASLRFGVKLLAQAHDNKRLMIVFAITQLGTSITLCILAYFLYAFFRSSYLVYEVPICGLAPVCASVLVMIKQFLPDSIVVGTPLGRIKYTHVPLNGILISLAASLIGLVRFVVVLEVLVGTQVSWTYLRFLSPHETDDIKGDTSDHFAWATMFPSAFRPFCTLVSKATFRSLVKLGVCKRQVRHVDVNSLMSGTASPVMRTLPVEQPANKDAERRRQKALMALNERLRATRKEQEEKVDWDEEDSGQSTAISPPSVRVESPPIDDDKEVHTTQPPVA